MGNVFKAQQWRTVDIPIVTSKTYASPFEDVDVFGIFKGPKGEEIKLLAYWDGEGTWKLRFAPVSVGTWTYTIESTDPENADFGGEGSVECVPYDGELDMYKHGFLKVSEDRDYLEYADGTPFFWLGDTHWTFVTEERFNESNCPKYESQFKACVDKRVAQKFNVYQCNFRDGKVNGFFGRNIDLMQETDHGYVPNIEEFKNNVDPKMAYLADAGLYIAVGYAWGFDMEPNGLDRYKAFAKYVAARYGAYPVAWTLAGELPGYLGDLEKNTKLWNEVAKVGDQWSVYGNLMSAHLACSRPFPKIYENEPWFDFAMSQAGHGDFDMDQIMYKEFKEMYKGHPVLESEATYEGATSNEYTSRIIPADMMRRLAYLIIQNGGCGYTYGCNGVWELQWEAGVGGIGWGDMAWWDGLELPGADQLTIFRDFYEEVGWSTLKPLPKEVARTKSFFMESTSRTDISFTGNKDLTKIVGYISQTSMHSFEIKGVTAQTYKMWFMDPEDGSRSEHPELLHAVDGVLNYDGFNAFANRKDLLMVLEAQFGA